MKKQLIKETMVKDCTYSSTCEHAPSTACLSCAHARTKVKGLSEFASTSCGRRGNGLSPFVVKKSETMGFANKRDKTMFNDSCFYASGLLVNPPFAEANTAFLMEKKVTCRESRHSSAASSRVLSDALVEDTERNSRKLHCCEMAVRKHKKFLSSYYWLHVPTILILLLASLCRTTTATLDITAFEYQRKFHKPLDLGECSQREVTVDTGNNSYYIEEQRCTLHQRGIVTHLPRELNDSRNVLIPSANGIVAYLGLCGGEAASFLGILNSGDCVAVEIASKLTFSDKTLVRAFVGYYRKSLDILEESSSTLEGMDRYYKDKFYLKNRSYGTLEIIFVQLRYETISDTIAAKKIELSTPVMSEYMRETQKRVGTPKNIVTISLSTATQETYELKQFKREEWARAVRHVEILELTIQKTREQINTNTIMPHLQYQLYPFVDAGVMRSAKPVLWEKISMLEVQLRQAVNLAKKTAKRCRGNKTRLCQRARALREALITTQAEIHKGRSNWVNLTVTEKDSFSSRFTGRVQTFSNVTKDLAKEVKEMKNKEKIEKTERKRKRLNQVPVEGRSQGQPRRSQHRIRHAKSKRRHKMNQGS